MAYRRNVAITLVVVGAVSPLNVFSASLSEVYHHALQEDPSYLQAEADWHSAEQLLPLSRAQALASVVATGGFNRTRQRSTPTDLANDASVNQWSYKVTLSQPLFNWATWEGIAQAGNQVHAAAAQWQDAQQQLVMRTVKAYLGVLQAYDQKKVAFSQQAALKQQLEVAKQQLHVGAIAKTEQYEARAAFDQARAQVIASQNQLDNAIEQLAVMTHQRYRSLSGFAGPMRLVSPQPLDQQQWVDHAVSYNSRLQAAQYSTLAAKSAIDKQIGAAWLPQVTAQLQQSWDVGRYHLVAGLAGHQSKRQTVYGAQLSLPLLQGGGGVAAITQAKSQYLSASEQQEAARRMAMSQTRQAYLGVLSKIDQVKADRLSVQSANKALAATRAGYRVGTRTMYDVLNSVSSRYKAESAQAADQYQLLLEMISLKYYAGNLSEADIRLFDRWLTKPLTVGSEK